MWNAIILVQDLNSCRRVHFLWRYPLLHWHNRYFHVLKLFQFPSKVEILILLFTFFPFYSVVRRDVRARACACVCVCVCVRERESILLLLLLFYSCSFSRQCWIQGDKFPRVSRTFQSILADLNNAVVWIALILLLVSNFSSPIFRTFGTVPNAQTITGFTTTLLFHRFFSCSSLLLF